MRGGTAPLLAAQLTLPPVIGNETPRRPARAGLPGATDTPAPDNADAKPEFSLSAVEPPSTRTLAPAAGAKLTSARAAIASSSAVTLPLLEH